MKIKKYQVDAFVEKLFQGNPAVVCILDQFLDPEVMQNIAAEHNLSETAFLVKANDKYIIRWFTPRAEVKLCGHATLASAYVIFNETDHQGNSVQFDTLHSGPLHVKKDNETYILDFPKSEVKQSSYTKDQISSILGLHVEDIKDSSDDLLVVLDNEEMLANFVPNIPKMMEIPIRGFILTAPSERYDFVSRFFGPRVGVNEDPVTGSAHTRLIPYWSERLGKNQMIAKQISRRGGILHCGISGDRVTIAGKAVLYSIGTILLP